MKSYPHVEDHKRAQPKKHDLAPRTMSCLFALSLAVAAGCGGGGGGYGDDDPGDDGSHEIDVPTPTAALPGRSSTIALTSNNQRLVVVNRQNHSVSVIQVRDANGQDTSQKLGEVSVGQEPRYVALSPDDKTAWVTNAMDGTVSVLDISNGTPVIKGSPIKVGTEPRGIAVTPNGRYALVANHTSGSISVIQTQTGTVINTVKVGGNPMAISISNDGDTDDRDEVVYITRFFSELIDPVNRPDGFNDSKQGVVDYFSVGDAISAQPAVAQHFIAPITDSGFAADRRHFCRNTRDILQTQGDVKFFNSGVQGTGNGAAALASDVFCPDTNSTDASANGAIAKTLQGAYPNQLFSAVLRDQHLYVPSVGASPEPPVKFNVNVQALVTTLDITSGNETTANINNQIKTEVQPSNPTTSLERLFGNELVAIDANAAGNDFLLVSRGGNYVIRASRATNGTLDIGAPNQVVRFQTGNIPSGVVMSLDGTRAYTNNEVNTSVTVMDLQTNSVLQRDISASEPPAPGTQKHRNIVGKLAFFTALGLPDTLDTDGNGSFDIGVRDIEPLAFRNKASDNGWSGCASCHDDGHADNVTWIFPTGPRQTIALEGSFSKNNLDDQRIMNWSGVQGSVTDFNNNARGVQGGIGFATDVNGADLTASVFNHGPTKGVSDSLDAMSEWVARSVRSPNMPAPEATSEHIGRQLFASNCSSCHGGEKWTKSSILGYQNNPTFTSNPLGADFFVQGGLLPQDTNLKTAGPQIASLNLNGTITNFLDNVGTRNGSNPLELRGAGTIGGGVISVAGDPNAGLAVTPQSTQGFASLGAAGFNTPSLLGIAYQAPYLHDGSAATLDEVFDRHQLPAAGNATISATIGDATHLKYLQDFVLSIDQNTATF